ncbi:hypothetical protein QPJ97_28820 (plasmid) [Klebsiella quasipneumoniae]
MKAFFFEVDRPERLMEGGIADSTGLSHTEKLITLRDNGLTLHKLLKPGAFHGVVSENGIYGHSRFCNTDFDDKLACLNLSGV